MSAQSDVNHSISDRRAAKEQTRQVMSDGAMTLLALYHPIIQLQSVMLHAWSDGVEAFASTINSQKNKLDSAA